MILNIFCRAPLRISFVGGGTELPPFIRKYGGCIISSTVELFANVKIQCGDFGGFSRVIQKDRKLDFTYKSIGLSEISAKDSPAPLQIASLQALTEKLNISPDFDIIMETYSDVPEGSGLGTSSTLTVALISALLKLFEHPLNKYEIAELAYEIERKKLNFLGGLQDHYAATFGGLNRIDFNTAGTTINSLPLRKITKTKLESWLFLYYTGISRNSGNIIEEQMRLLELGDSKTMALMLKIKDLVEPVEKCLINGDFKGFGELLHESWIHKKSVTDKITNSKIDEIYNIARDSGISGGKLIGAGGGGYLLFVCEPAKISRVKMAILNKDPDATFKKIEFHNKGVRVWKNSKQNKVIPKINT
jgi:D-glycero-alpha-D-manno-heptose-7-phosphate kinase